MRKVRYAVFIAVVVTMLGACATGSSLNVGELTDPTFELTKVEIISLEELDEESFLNPLLEVQLATMIDTFRAAAEAEGARVETSVFLEAYEAGELEVQRVVEPYTSQATLHLYSWELEESFEQSAEMEMTSLAREGLYFGHIVLLQMNPDDPERPNRLQIQAYVPEVQQ